MDEIHGFRDAFDQASLKDKLQLISDYKLPNSIETQCDVFFDSSKYKTIYGTSLSKDQLSKIEECFDELKKEYRLNSNKIFQDFKEILPRLSLDELKDLQQSLAPKKLGNNDENGDFYKNHKALITRHFINGNVVHIQSVMRTQSMLSFLQKQNDLIQQHKPKYLIEQHAQPAEPQKSLCQEIATQFIRDQESSSESIDPMNLQTHPSEDSQAYRYLNELQNSVNNSTSGDFTTTKKESGTHNDDNDYQKNAPHP